MVVVVVAAHVAAKLLELGCCSPSAIYARMHYLNPGGHSLGPIATTEYRLVTCLVLRRTGDLWMALGIHCAWDWGAMFFWTHNILLTKDKIGWFAKKAAAYGAYHMVV